MKDRSYTAIPAQKRDLLTNCELATKVSDFLGFLFASLNLLPSRYYYCYYLVVIFALCARKPTQ